MTEEEATKLHTKFKCFPKFTTNPHLVGGVLELPINIFLPLPEQTRIYESYDGNVTVYSNKKKIINRAIPNYAIKMFIITDAYKECLIYGYSPTLLKVGSKSKKIDFVQKFLEVLSNVETDNVLEKQLLSKWFNIFLNEKEPVDPAIQEGYDIIFQHFTNLESLS